LKKDVLLQRIEQQLHNSVLQKRISDFRNKIKHEICFDLPNAFWKRKQHIVDVPYKDNFFENIIPIKARPFQMNVELEQHCRLKIQDLESKGLI